MPLILFRSPILYGLTGENEYFSTVLTRAAASVLHKLKTIPQGHSVPKSIIELLQQIWALSHSFMFKIILKFNSIKECKLLTLKFKNYNFSSTNRMSVKG